MKSQEIKSLEKHNQQLRAEADYYKNIAVKAGGGRLKDVVQLSNVISQLNETKAQLERARKELEARVTERTKELSQTNLELQQEIVEHKKAKEELHRYQHIISTSSDSMSFVDRNYIYRAVNEAYLHTHQKTGQEIIGHSVADLLGTDVFEQFVQENLNRCFAGETIRYQAWFDFPGAGRRYLDVFYHPFRNPYGEITGAVASSRDITKLEQAEQALRESEALFRSVFRDVPDAMVLANTDRKIVLINPALTNTFGYSLEEIQGQQTAVLYESREEFEHQGRIRFNLRAEQKIKPCEFNYRRKNGKIFPGETVGTAIKDENGTTIAFLRVIRDISERKAAEKELLETNAALRVLLKTRQDDQKKFEEKILFHVKKIVLPHVERLKNYRLSQDQLLHLTSIEVNLNDIVSSFSYTLSSKFRALTPTEIQVANLVRQGQTSKEIASLLQISLKTVEVHRYHIRKKLGLNRKKGNLRSLLISSFPLYT